MPGKDNTAKEEGRKRNSSKPPTGIVGDIAEVFKKQMASPNANSPVSEKPIRRTSNRNKSKENKDQPKRILKEDENGMLGLHKIPSEENLNGEDQENVQVEPSMREGENANANIGMLNKHANDNVTLNQNEQTSQTNGKTTENKENDKCDIKTVRKGSKGKPLLSMRKRKLKNIKQQPSLKP